MREVGKRCSQEGSEKSGNGLGRGISGVSVEGHCTGPGHHQTDANHPSPRCHGTAMINDEQHQQASLDKLWRKEELLEEEEQDTADGLIVSLEGFSSNKKMMIHLLYLKRAMMMMECTIQRLGSGLILYDKSTNQFRSSKTFKPLISNIIVIITNA